MNEVSRSDDDNNLKGLMEHLTLKNKKKRAKSRRIKMEPEILCAAQDSVGPEGDIGVYFSSDMQSSLTTNSTDKSLIEAAILEGDEAAELKIYNNGSFNFVTCNDDADDEISRFLQNGHDQTVNGCVVTEVTTNQKPSIETTSVAETISSDAEQTEVEEAVCNVNAGNETPQQQQLLEEAQAADLEDDDDIIILDDETPTFFNDDLEVEGRLTIADENEVNDVKPNVVNVQNLKDVFLLATEFVDETVELVDECLMDQTDQGGRKNASDNTFLSTDIAIDERNCDFSKFTQFAVSVSDALADIPTTVTVRRHSMFGGDLKSPDTNTAAIVVPPDVSGVSNALYSSTEDEDGIIFVQHVVNNNYQPQQQNHPAPPIYQQTSPQQQNQPMTIPDVIEISEDECEPCENTTSAFYEHIPRSSYRSFGRSRSCAPRSAHRARSQSRHHNRSRHQSRAGSRFTSRRSSPRYSNGGSSWYNNGGQSSFFAAAASSINDTMINSSGIPIFRRRSGSRRASSRPRSKSCRREVPRAYEFCNGNDAAFCSTNDDNTMNNVLPIYERNRATRRQYQERHRSVTRGGFADRVRQGRSKSQASTRYNSPPSVRRRYDNGNGNYNFSRRRSPSSPVWASMKRSDMRRRRSISKFRSLIRCTRSRSRSSISSTSTYSRYSSHRRYRRSRRSPSRCRSRRRRSRSSRYYRSRSLVPSASPSASLTSYHRGGGISSSDSSSRYRRTKSRSRRHEETPPRTSRYRRSPSTHRSSHRNSRDDEDTITLSKDHLFRLLQKVLENSGSDNTASRLANDFLQNGIQKPSNYFADVSSINASNGSAPQQQIFESANVNTVNSDECLGPVDSFTNRKRPGDLSDERSLKNSRFNAITAMSMIETYENVAGPSNGTMLWP